MCDYSLSRTNIIHGEGGSNAKLMIVGESPNHQEDKEGKPGLDKSGILLRKMLKYAGFDNPKSYYITTAIISKVNPKIIITLGKIVSEIFSVRTNISMKDINGTYITTNEKRHIYRLYHPSYILHNEHLLSQYKKSFMMLAWLYKNTVDDYHKCDALNILLNK